MEQLAKPPKRAAVRGPVRSLAREPSSRPKAIFYGDPLFGLDPFAEESLSGKSKIADCGRAVDVAIFNHGPLGQPDWALERREHLPPESWAIAAVWLISVVAGLYVYVA